MRFLVKLCSAVFVGVVHLVCFFDQSSCLMRGMTSLVRFRWSWPNWLDRNSDVISASIVCRSIWWSHSYVFAL